MSKCVYADRCPFYLMYKEGGEFNGQARSYCETGGKECSRKRIREVKGLSAVPKILLPDGSEADSDLF